MPVTSRRQARFMGAVASGKRKVKGLSRAKAKEFLRGSKLSSLPESATRRRGKRISKARRKYSKRPSMKRRLSASRSVSRAARDFKRAMLKG